MNCVETPLQHQQKQKYRGKLARGVMLLTLGTPRKRGLLGLLQCHLDLDGTRDQESFEKILFVFHFGDILKIFYCL